MPHLTRKVPSKRTPDQKLRQPIRFEDGSETTFGEEFKNKPQRRRLPDILVQQSQAQSFVHSGSRPSFTSKTVLGQDLGGQRSIATLLGFTSEQRRVIKEELSPAQRNRLSEVQFNPVPLPIQRAPRGVGGQRHPPFTAAAIGGGEAEPNRAQGRPKTMLNLETRSGLPRLARHEIAHQLTETTGDIQHASFVLAGEESSSSASAGRKFFERIAGISRDVTPIRESRPAPRTPDQTVRQSDAAARPPAPREEPANTNLRNLLGMNI